MFREDNIPADMSAKEMYQHLLSNCIIYSFPPISLVDIMYQQMCGKKHYKADIITTCNVTGRWDVFNNTVYEACADEYLSKIDSRLNLNEKQEQSVITCFAL
jgi:hypothetical protein